MNENVESVKPEKNIDECIELKNIKYQTMLIHNNNSPNIAEKVKPVDLGPGG